MTWYRKNANGELVKTAGNIIQKINNGLLETTHEVIGGADYYTINPSAKKYITGLTNYTEFSLHISELNETNTVYIRYNDKTLELKKTDNSAIDTESLLNKISVYTLDTSTGIIWIDYNDLTLAMNRINAIKSLIPKQASTDNQLADKDFVNSSISTSTATFRGTYTNIGDLSTIEADENDYIWFDNFDELGNRKFDKYKYSNGEWKYEYTLNNSSFTEAQWKALNSGITQELLNTILNNVNELLTITTELNNSKVDKETIGQLNNLTTTNKSNIVESINEVNTKQNVLQPQKPKGTYENLSALQTAYPSGASGVYLTSDNGHWYYWNGTQYADGGVYQTAVNYDELEKSIYNLANNKKMLYIDATHTTDNATDDVNIPSGSNIYVEVDTTNCDDGFIIFSLYDSSNNKLPEATDVRVNRGLKQTIIMFNLSASVVKVGFYCNSTTKNYNLKSRFLIYSTVYIKKSKHVLFTFIMFIIHLFSFY